MPSQPELRAAQMLVYTPDLTAPELDVKSGAVPSFIHNHLPTTNIASASQL